MLLKKHLVAVVAAVVVAVVAAVVAVADVGEKTCC